MRPLRSKLPEIYGPITNWEWERQKEFMTFLKVPDKLFDSFRYQGNVVSRVYLNKDMVPALSVAFELIIKQDLAKEIKSYDGCFNLRYSRGGSRISTHAYGLALDLNAETNKLGDQPTINRNLVGCFISAGFVWGGSWKHPDGMHFQFVTED